MSNVAVIGWYDHNNVGDESYKSSLQTIFANKNLYFSDRYQKGNFDFVILGGGNVCSHKFLDEIEKFNCPKIAFSIGFTDEFPAERMNIFNKIFVRDNVSKYLLAKNNINSTVIPDAAFALIPDKENGKKIIKNYFKKEGRDLYENVIGITINSYLCTKENGLARDENTFQKVTYDLAKIADNTNASFIFIPFGQSQPSDDRVSNYWTAGKCKYWKKNVVISDKIHYQDVLDIISSCNAVISTRLHSSIFSTLCCVPFIDIIHHSKNQSFIKEIRKEDWSFDYWDFPRKQAMYKLNEFIQTNNCELISTKKQFVNKIMEVRKNEWI